MAGLPISSKRGDAPLPSNYKWIALSNTTLGMLMATINSSIVLIALPDIFRGIKIDLGLGRKAVTAIVSHKPCISG